MQPRRYNKRQGLYDSNQEASIHSLYPHLRYHPRIAIDYSIDYVYQPDFFLGYEHDTNRPVYIEAKEYFTTDMCIKYISICKQNTNMHLLLLVKTVVPEAEVRLRSCGVPNLHLYTSNMILPTEWILKCKETI